MSAALDPGDLSRALRAFEKVGRELVLIGAAASRLGVS
jgi:hypothetical protein